MENYYDGPFGGGGFFRRGHRMGRGFMTPIILEALLEKPMHGYELIQYLEKKSHGFWRPSAGSIYPTLQLLEEQELVRSHEQDGKKVYELTEAGKKAAEEGSQEEHAHWKSHFHKGKRLGFLRETLPGLMESLREIGLNGSEDHIAQAKGMIDQLSAELKEIAREVRETRNQP